MGDPAVYFNGKSVLESYKTYDEETKKKPFPLLARFNQNFECLLAKKTF